MSYQPRPDPSGDTLVASRDQIRTNFEIIQDRFEDDHTEYSTGTGKHDKTTMPEQASAPTTAANEGAFYTKVGTNPAETNAFFRAESNGFEYQITKSISASTGRFGSTPNGWTFLPGNLLFQWGRVDTPGGSGTVTFATDNVAFPTACFSVMLTPRNDGSHSAFTYYLDGAPTSTAFSYRGSTTGSNALFWIAIGN
jgi:hypothetical protein